MRRIEISAGLKAALIDHAIAEIPYEGCGLLVGRRGTNRIDAWIVCPNAARSAKRFEISDADIAVARSNARATGAEIIGVVHSHTHTPAYPSASDLDRPIDPTWIYLVASLQRLEPSIASFTIRDGVVFADELLEFV